MIKKLIELDGRYGYPKEVDPVKVKRVASDFKVWLEKLNPGDDKFGFLRLDLPLVKAALNGTLSLPYRESNPHSWEIGEGMLDQHLEVIAPFYNAIKGATLSMPPEVIEKDGRYYVWCEFEE